MKKVLNKLQKGVRVDNSFFAKHYLTILKLISIAALFFFSYTVVVLMKNSFWRDEAFTALLVDKNYIEILKLMAKDTNPPLHPLILRTLVIFFGNTELVLRSISVLSMIGTVIALRLIIKKKAVKEYATILFLTSFHIYQYATEARYYALFMCLTAFSFYAMQRLTKEFSKRNALLFIIVSILLLYSQTLGVIVFISNGLIFLYIKYKQKSLEKRTFWKWVSINAVAFIVFTPWIFIVASQLKELQNNGFWLTFDPVKSLVETSSSFFYDKGDFYKLGLFAWVGVIVYAVSFIVGAVYLYNHKKYKYLLAFLVPYTLVYLISFKQPLFYIRYELFLFPFLAIITGIGLSRYKKYSTLVCIALILFFNITVFLKFNNKDTKPPFRQLVQELKKVDLTGYKFLNDQEYSYFQCEHYFGNCAIIKDYNQLNKSLGLSLVPKEAAISEETAVSYNKIVMLYWNDTYPHFKFLANYKIVGEQHLKTDYDKLNAVLYEKI